MKKAFFAIAIAFLWCVTLVTGFSLFNSFSFYMRAEPASAVVQSWAVEEVVRSYGGVGLHPSYQIIVWEPRIALAFQAEAGGFNGKCELAGSRAAFGEKKNLSKPAAVAATTALVNKPYLSIWYLEMGSGIRCESQKSLNLNSLGPFLLFAFMASVSSIAIFGKFRSDDK